MTLKKELGNVETFDFIHCIKKSVRSQGTFLMFIVNLCGLSFWISCTWTPRRLFWIQDWKFGSQVKLFYFMRFLDNDTIEGAMKCWTFDIQDHVCIPKNGWWWNFYDFEKEGFSVEKGGVFDRKPCTQGGVFGPKRGGFRPKRGGFRFENQVSRKHFSTEKGGFSVRKGGFSKPITKGELIFGRTWIQAYATSGEDLR